MITRLSCSECGCATYIRGQASDVTCELCANEVDWRDFQLDGGEKLEWDDDGYLVVNRTLCY